MIKKVFFIDYHQNDKNDGERKRAFFLMNEPNVFFLYYDDLKAE